MNIPVFRSWNVQMLNNKELFGLLGFFCVELKIVCSNGILNCLFAYERPYSEAAVLNICTCMQLGCTTSEAHWCNFRKRKSKGGCASSTRWRLVWMAGCQQWVSYPTYFASLAVFWLSSGWLTYCVLNLESDQIETFQASIKKLICLIGHLEVICWFQARKKCGFLLG